MNKQREALQVALDALEDYQANGAPFFKCDSAVKAIREALAEQEQKPVAWLSEGGDVSRSKRYMDEMGFICEPLYTVPPARRSLTDEEILNLWEDRRYHCEGEDFIKLVRWIERWYRQ